MVCDCLSDSACSDPRGVSDGFKPAPCNRRIPDRVPLQHRTLRGRSIAHQGGECPLEEGVGGGASPRRSLRGGRGGFRGEDDDQPELAHHREPSLQPLDRNQLGPTSSPHSLPRSVQHCSADPPDRTHLPRNQGTKTATYSGLSHHDASVRS